MATIGKYIGTKTSVVEHRRYVNLTINDPYKGAPSLMFQEERVLERTDGSVLHDNAGTLSKQVLDTAETFSVFDKATKARTGATARFADLDTLLYSVYMNEAIKRDAQVAFNAVMAEAQLAQKALMESTSAATEQARAKAELDEAIAYSAALTLAASNPKESQTILANYATAKQTRQAATILANKTAWDANTAAVAKADASARASAQAAYDAVIKA